MERKIEEIFKADVELPEVVQKKPRMPFARSGRKEKEKNAKES